MEVQTGKLQEQLTERIRNWVAQWDGPSGRLIPKNKIINIQYVLKILFNVFKFLFGIIKK